MPPARPATHRRCASSAPAMVNQSRQGEHQNSWDSPIRGFYVCTCLCMYIYIYMYWFIYLCVSSFIHSFMCIYIYIYTHMGLGTGNFFGKTKFHDHHVPLQLAITSGYTPIFGHTQGHGLTAAIRRYRFSGNPQKKKKTISVFFYENELVNWSADISFDQF